MNCMLNPGVPKCDEDLITVEIYVEQGKTMNYMPQCEFTCQIWKQSDNNLLSFFGGHGVLA